jgi:endonuclease/exonuclease/phosphatase family metal-dependent hydrolase
MEQAAPISSHCPEVTLPPEGGSPSDTLGLRWYRPAENRDRELQEAWCSTVGEPAIALAPTGSFPAWTADSGLEVVTWNLQIGGGDFYRFVEQELGLDCLAERPSMAPGARPFVLLVQETWRHSEDLPVVEDSEVIPWTIDPEQKPALNPDVVEAAGRCGLSLVYVPSARNGPDDGSRPREDKGNAVLSTLPLSSPVAFDLPLEGGRKVAVGATVTAPGGERLRAVSVHLDVASTLVRSLISGNQTRRRQAAGLLDGLEEAERDGLTYAATVVGGDFNTWAGNEATLKLMRQEFPESPTWDGRGTRGPYPTDHIFFRTRGDQAFDIEAAGRIDDAHGSDHNARRLLLGYDQSAAAAAAGSALQGR